MSGERSLPKGWIVRQSKSYPDKVYYFNVETGASIWEHPDILNSSSERETGLNMAESIEDDMLGFEYKNDPRVAFLERKVYERLTKSLDSEKRTSIKRKSEKSYNIPTAVVTPLGNKKFASSKHDPRLFRRNISSSSMTGNCVCGNAEISATKTLQSRDFSVDETNLSDYCLNEDESSETSSPSSDENQDFSVGDSNMSMNCPISGQVNVDRIDKSVEYYFVLDTNVLLGNLRLLKEMFHSIGKNNVPHLFIPWVVIQEINNILRRYTIDHKLYHMAKICNKYINVMVRKKHPRFHCQTVEEVKDWAKEYSECNDDQLIECCLSLSEKMPLAKVILVTNDVNLDTKAHIFNIPIFSVKDLVANFDFSLKFYPKSQNFCTEIQKSSRFSTNFSKSPKTPNIVEKEVLANRKWSSVRLSLPGKTFEKKGKSQIMSEAFLELKNVLHPFLVAELQKVHGDNLKTNLSLKSILNTAVQHWTSICRSSSSSDKVRRNLMLLQTKCKTSDYSHFSRDDYLNTLTAIEDIFCDIKRKCPSMDVNIENIQDMRVACINLFTEDKGAPRKDDVDTLERTNMNVSTTTADNSVSLDSEVVSRVLEHNWTVLNHLCGMILDFYCVPHDLDYDKPGVVPPRSEFEHMLSKLRPGVEEIKTLLRKIINTDSAPPSVDYEKFASLLLNFVPSLQIETESVDTTHFNATCLSKYCQAVVNSEVLLEAYRLLDIYCSKLEEALVKIGKI